MQPKEIHHITKEILLKYVEQDFSTYAIARALTCSQSNIRFHLRKHGINTHVKSKTPLTVEKKKANNKLSYISQQKRGELRKLEAIKQKGGKCKVCGYSKNYSALAFHHIDPNNKTFPLDLRRFSNTNEKSLAK